MAQTQPQSPTGKGWETGATATVETFLQKLLDQLREGIGITDGFIWQFTDNLSVRETPLRPLECRRFPPASGTPFKGGASFDFVKIGCYSSVTPPISQNLLTLWRKMVQASDSMLRQGQLLVFPSSSQPISSHFQTAQDSYAVFSVLLVPLSLRNSYLGGICLYNRYQKYHWSDEALNLVQTVAKQCALALEPVQADGKGCFYELLTLINHKLATSPEMSSGLAHSLQLIGEHFSLDWVILGYLEADRLKIQAEWARERLGVAQERQTLLDEPALSEAIIKGRFYEVNAGSDSQSAECTAACDSDLKSESVGGRSTVDQSHLSTLSASSEVGQSHLIVAFPLIIGGKSVGSLVLPSPQPIDEVRGSSATSTDTEMLEGASNIVSSPKMGEGASPIGDSFKRQSLSDYFAPQDLQTLTLIADRLAIALFNQQLQQRIESQEAENQRLQAISQTKSDYLSHLHHELRTPLTGVLGFAKMLREELYGPLNDKQKQYVSGIVISGQHLLALVNDFLDLSKIEAEREELWLETVAVEDICLAAISMVQVKATEQGLDLCLTIAQDVDFCTLDQRRIKQILLNLLSNAIKFTEKGSVTLKVQREAQMLTFSIIDTGIGIKPEDQAKLFAPFQQIYNHLSRKHKGTGLGLALSRELARLHGGDLTVTSQEGQGSCFTLNLPTQPVSEVEKGEI